MLLPLLSVFSSTAHIADDGGCDAAEESPNCALHGIPTNGAPCPACLHEATQLVVTSTQPDGASATNVARLHGPIVTNRMLGALDEPTGCGHQDLGASYA